MTDEDDNTSEDDFEDAFDDDHLYDEAEFEREGWNEVFNDPETFSKALDAFGKILPGAVKETVSESVGRVAFDEERLRKLLSQSNMPKEVVKFVLAQINSTKREITRVVAREIREFLEDTDLAGEVARMLTRLSFEVTMEVRFVPNDDAITPNMKGKVRTKKRDAEPDQSSEESGSN